MNNTYGTNKPAFITSDDCDIFYYYKPSRSTESEDFTAFKKIDSTILSKMNYEDDGENVELPGMYNLRLPMDIFSNVGIYTIYIKPKEIKTTIVDVSVLSAYSTIRGIVLNTKDLGNDILGNNGNLVGYRVEYFDDDSNRSSEYRIITSNYKCEPMVETLTSTSQKGISYRYNDNSNLTFCTLTPSTAMSFKSTSLPNIGTTGQQIALINTKFNPICIELEIVEHDAETISTMLEGEQLRNLTYGEISTFNKNGEIYHQAKYGNIKDSNNTMNHDFKIESSTIDFTEEDKLKEIKSNI